MDAKTNILTSYLVCILLFTDMASYLPHAYLFCFSSLLFLPAVTLASIQYLKEEHEFPLLYITSSSHVELDSTGQVHMLTSSLSRLTFLCTTLGVVLMMRPH